MQVFDRCRVYLVTMLDARDVHVWNGQDPGRDANPRPAVVVVEGGEQGCGGTSHPPIAFLPPHLSLLSLLVLSSLLFRPSHFFPAFSIPFSLHLSPLHYFPLRRLLLNSHRSFSPTYLLLLPYLRFSHISLDVFPLLFLYFSSVIYGRCRAGRAS